MKNQSVIGILFSEDKSKVLLIKRRDVPVWVLPGGGIEDNESADAAITREIFEETGYNVSIIRKVGEYIPINKLAKYTYLYEIKIIKGEISTGSETREIAFFPLDKLPRLIPPPFSEWIDDAISNKNELIRRKLISVNYFTLIKQVFFHPILIFRFLLTKIGLTINT
jgi:8-oxo-dGTP diphosphatase